MIKSKVVLTAGASLFAMALTACGGGDDGASVSEKAADAKNAAENAANDAAETTGNAAGAVKQAAGNAANSAKEAASETADGMKKAGEDMANKAGEMANNAADSAKAAGDKMADSAKAAGDAMADKAGQAAAGAAGAAAAGAAAVKTAASDAGKQMAEKTANAVAGAADDAANGVQQAAYETTDGIAYASLTGDATAGKRVFTKCMACHVVKEGQNRVGPSLYGVVGREAGSIDGFNYSEANANSGIVWTEATLYAYLENPQEFIPGTRMIFTGLPKAQDRADAIAYIMQESGQ